MKEDVLALDLEGTLISNAMSQFPRTGLYRFLELCGEQLPRVVLYTAVRHPVARAIAQTLVQEESAPAWFEDIEYVQWSGAYKDLGFVERCWPRQVLLVDDNEDYIAPGQRERWIPIEEFAHPYVEDDELQRVWGVIQRRMGVDAAW